MIRRDPLLALLLLLLFVATLRAQPAGPATGLIEGRVLNAASGTYLEGARVTVEGTTLEAFTDPDGRYRLVGVPAGEVRVRVFYTGAAPQTAVVRVAAGQMAAHDVSLGVAATAARGDTVKLDRFVVGESREMEGAAIAINEQRFAANIKNVVSTDEFGAVSEGNVTEFLKYLPGVTVDMSGGDGRYISIEGAPAANTPITLGGIGLSSPGDNNTSRGIEVGFFNLNNVSRIEAQISSV